MQDHIQKDHNNDEKVVVQIHLFSVAVPTVSSPEPVDPTTASNVAGPSTGPVRGRQLHLQVRATPYERSGESSSLSSSPSRRASLASLSPLQIPSPLAHLPTPPAIPSPLNQVAYSRPSSPTPPSSDREMNVDNPELPDIDDAQLPLDDKEILSKALISIALLPHLQTTPPTRLLVCTKCNHGLNPSSLLTHLNKHHIKLLPAERRSLKEVLNHSTFLNDSILPPSPTPPCPPIDGINPQDGFACSCCSYCCVSFGTMQFHFSQKHKDAVGSAKAKSTPVQVQSLFARRPNYFAVTSSLSGVDEDDLFAVYLQQCAPEIEALRVLNPPLNPNEVPPLLKVTQWHEHLKDYTQDRNSVQKLLELTKLPTSRQGEAWIGSPLRATIEGYMKDVRVKANTASLGIRCLLKECPRFVTLLI